MDIKYFDINWVQVFISLISSGRGGCVGGVCVCVNMWSEAALRTNSACNKWSNFFQKLITAPLHTANVDIVLNS